ncbi:DUF1285 domain-containing protein [Thalassomonas sp. M1454]|uniref:DUF1285 domain-containing protein n=1 Tax=Thalassomonas sp. M1454 TaxID=2594477 RepID=UPI001180B4B5|nr:DUF1285 domain-containing protein [Thalassomonas sp. M1454]TRX54914.1 DUF1285 domain-containing protein [Thalassomonas sp. M1454]
MSLEAITKQLKSLNQSIPPVELWDPPYCGEMDIVIKANGDWFYNGSIISRLRLVKLFASVIKKEEEDYFLVTPVEKIKIKVEDKPFVITNWQWLEDLSPATIKLTTNLGDSILLCDEHPLECDSEGNLSVKIRRNLFASVHRNVFYQWVDIAKEESRDQQKQLILTSAGQDFIIGRYSD